MEATEKPEDLLDREARDYQALRTQRGKRPGIPDDPAAPVNLP